MTEAVGLEPALADDCCRFKPVLVFFDLAASDSMIRPIDLSRRKLTSTKPAKHCYRVVAPPCIDEQLVKRKRRRYEEPVDCETRSDPPLVTATVEEGEPDETVQVSVSPSMDLALAPESRIISIDETGLFEPIREGTHVIVEFRISKKGIPLDIFDCASGKVVLTAKKGSGMGYSVRICTNDDAQRQVAAVNATFTRRAFWSTSGTDTSDREIAAINFKVQKKTPVKMRTFVSYVPKEGTVIPVSNDSVLLQKMESVFAMEPKMPKMKGGIPCMYFGGRVKMQSVKNHILVNQAGEGQYLVFGKARENVFVGEYYPPLSPIQGICLSVPHLS